jgi:DNA-binding LacI/PurR family transcriptional regulator
MPGGDRLARDLGVGRSTIDLALKQLEAEGSLLPQGVGRRRRIAVSNRLDGSQLRVRILPFDRAERDGSSFQELLHRIKAAGHAAEFTEETMVSLRMDARRVARLIGKTPADAWVVVGGSQEVLATFAKGPVPAFAMVGRMRGVPIAGVKPDKIPAQRDAVRRLVSLGHSRIVKLVLPERVLPVPGTAEQAFLNELRLLGIPTGPYNLAVWEGGPAEFHERLDSIFRHTPPTALFLDAPELFVAAQLHLARRGILAPEHVSLVSYDPDPFFEMLEPKVSHIDWSFDGLSSRLVSWLRHVACGREDRRQTFVKAVFVEGGTIGPAMGSRFWPLKGRS